MKSEYFSLAVKNLKKRKLRSLLTLLGILISIATIFVLISISLGLNEAVQEQFRMLGTDKFFVQPKGQLAGAGTGGAVMLTKADVNILEKVSGVKDLSYWTASSAKIQVRDQVRFVPTVGVDLNTADLFVETGSYKAQEGRLLKKGDVKSVMIGSQYLEGNVFKKPVHAGDTILINDQPFKVRGILSTVGNSQDDRLIYMPEEDFRTLFNIPDRIDMIVVQVDPGQNLSVVADRAEHKLQVSRGVRKNNLDFTVLTPEELLASFDVILNILTGFLLGIAAISLIVGSIGIANTMFTSVLERTKEIGVMKAIGAKNSDILSIFLIESGMLGLIGGILGVLVGIGVSKLIEYVVVTQLGSNLLRAALPYYLMLGCLAFAFLIGALSGLWPAWKATKIKPVDALRYE